MTLFTFCSIGISAQTKIIKANSLDLGFGIGIEKRFYFQTNKSLKSFHAGPNVGYLNLSNDSNDRMSAFRAGIEIGHLWFLSKNFTVDLFSGAVFFTSSPSLNETLFLCLGLSLGYAW